MGCSRQAWFKFHLYKQSSHITISSLCFLNLTSCTVNYNICNCVLYRGLRPLGNVFYHNKVSSYGSTHSYLWVVHRCSVGTTVPITSLIMCCTEVCSHLVMSFITIKSLHIDLLIHIFGWYADVLWAQLVHSTMKNFFAVHRVNQL